MMTAAPLPGWKNIFGGLFGKQAAPDALSLPWRRDGETAGWLSLSAWSLALIAEWRKTRFNREAVVVWVPDYFCNASLQPLRESGARLVFYPIGEDMLPNQAACKEMAQQEAPDIFILVHYFGKPAQPRFISDFCSIHNTWLVEDAAHVLKPTRGVGALGDFVLYSPHKLLPIPDGALLVICPAGPSKFGDTAGSFAGSPDTWINGLQRVQDKMRPLLKSPGKHTMLWIIKRVIQKLGIKFWTDSALPFEENLAAELVRSPMIGPEQSSLSRKLLGTLTADLYGIARKRQRNQLLLDELLLSHKTVKATDRPAVREWTPYLSGYSGQPDELKAEYWNLHKSGLPVSTWPDLPPEVIAERDRFPVAWSLRHSRIFLSIHQTVSHPQLIRRLEKTQVSPPAGSTYIDWEIADKGKWNEWLTEAGKSNLLQSWEYGNSKAAKEGWAVKRGVFLSNGEAVAIIQLLQKRMFKLATVNRINRGPLLLRELTPGETRALYSAISSLGNVWKRKLLMAAPEMPVSGSSLLHMHHSGWKQFSLRPWESIVVDLSAPIDAIRKKLDSKWRNMLNFAEKSGLHLEVGEGDDLFHWMMGQYQELMAEKKFGGMSPEFLAHFRNELSDGNHLIVFRASVEGEYIAGICVVCHGDAATYLIGWNGQRGRTLKANQFLLWNAIVHLQKMGIRHFDLGGINETDVPGITAFKSGVNGDFYELVGEYVKW